MPSDDRSLDGDGPDVLDELGRLGIAHQSLAHATRRARSSTNTVRGSGKESFKKPTTLSRQARAGCSPPSWQSRWGGPPRRAHTHLEEGVEWGARSRRPESASCVSNPRGDDQVLGPKGADRAGEPELPPPGSRLLGFAVLGSGRFRLLPRARPSPRSFGVARVVRVLDARNHMELESGEDVGALGEESPPAIAMVEVDVEDRHLAALARSSPASAELLK